MSTLFSPSDYLQRTSREYAIYCCDTRGIPHVSDGLKHVQRVALWMLRNRAEKVKTFALSGLLGYEKLHVHGEKSANDAISLLAAPYRNNVCLIEGLGQFGSRVMPDGEGIGAPRYTEVRRARAAEALLYRDLDLVPLVDNYDGSNEQPVTFLPLIPLVLLNGVSGIAVGWSTEILPRSLKSLIEATKNALLGKPIAVIPPHYARYHITVAATGKPNQWEFCGRAEIVDSSTVKISELPPGLSIENFRKRLNTMEDSDAIQGYTDRSTDNIDITVKLKRGSIKAWQESDAIDFFKLRERNTERIVVIDWTGGAVRTYGNAEDLVRDFAQWRLGWFSKRYEVMRKNAIHEARYWNALDWLFEAEFPKTLGSMEDRASMERAVRAVIEAMAPIKYAKGDVPLWSPTLIDDGQIDRLVNLPTFRWTHEFAGEVKVKLAGLLAAIVEHDAILACPEKLTQVYIDELDALRSLKA